ncbi:MAG TPA: hypothetical protein PLD25_32520, partial [Chloroflexota bacterium]|nr:hypothetical protein [Chloroflexota bacterium]HUM68462.1 hypothetical protein [Chloroflexota bacterium]
ITPFVPEKWEIVFRCLLSENCILALMETTKNRGLPLVRVMFGRPVDALLFDTGHSVQDFPTWFHNLPPFFGGLRLLKTKYYCIIVLAIIERTIIQG